MAKMKGMISGDMCKDFASLSNSKEVAAKLHLIVSLLVISCSVLSLKISLMVSAL